MTRRVVDGPSKGLGDALDEGGALGDHVAKGHFPPTPHAWGMRKSLSGAKSGAVMKMKLIVGSILDEDVQVRPKACVMDVAEPVCPRIIQMLAHGRVAPTWGWGLCAEHCRKQRPPSTSNPAGPSAAARKARQQAVGWSQKAP